MRTTTAINCSRVALCGRGRRRREDGGDSRVLAGLRECSCGGSARRQTGLVATRWPRDLELMAARSSRSCIPTSYVTSSPSSAGCGGGGQVDILEREVTNVRQRRRRARYACLGGGAEHDTCRRMTRRSRRRCDRDALRSLTHLAECPREKHSELSMYNDKVDGTVFDGGATSKSSRSTILAWRSPHGRGRRSCRRRLATQVQHLPNARRRPTTRC